MSSSCGLSATLPTATVSTPTSTVSRFVHVFSSRCGLISQHQPVSSYLIGYWLVMCADAAAADSVEASPAGELLPDELGVLPAGLDVSCVSAVGSESGRRFAQTR